MLHQDYLVRMIIQFIEAIRQSMRLARSDKKPRIAAEMLDVAIGEATEIDGGILLSLMPESMVEIMQVSGTDQHLVGYIAHSLQLASYYYAQANESALSYLRDQQAQAVAKAYGIELTQVFSESVVEDYLYTGENKLQ